MNFKHVFKPGLLIICIGLLMMSCSDDDNDLNSGETYETNVYITDSPLDNAEVEGVFITVAEVMVNGEAIDNFSKTTFEISSLHSGSTELLGSLNLESGATSDISLVLDNESDASGDSPGNYVLTADGEAHAITSSSSEIVVNDDVEIAENNDNEIVLDFNLRKMLTANEGEYAFVSDSQLSNSIRAVQSAETGVISGSVTDFGEAENETVVVYAYEAGTYEESEAEANNGLRFANAVNSSIVAENSSDFSLHFMEESDYELHFVSYTDSDQDGQLEFEGEIEATATGETDLSLLNISLESNTEVEINVVFSGLLSI